MYIPITYIPDGPVTAALKRRVRGRRPKPQLGNLGPMLDANVVSARKQGVSLYHPDDLRLLPGVDANPDIVDEGIQVMNEILIRKGIREPTTCIRELPYYPDVRSIVRLTILLAVVMTAAITVAVLVGQENAIAAMVAAIVVISVAGALVFGLIVQRCVIHVHHPTETD